ncbi:UrcA family protein [Sandarakinorhabdus rubra]|uniref:UrcA family protein n=1 Tax=Sandarakinorhabdus rubra TaxID=2672568 RepID=UPI0013DC5E74|nr:UrcA family protein [Sandarakinorhabdus rubra]
MRILKAAMMVAMATTTLAAPAMAAGPGYAESRVKVQTADLDLTSAAGQQVLVRRLEMAITRLCGTPIFQTRDELDELAACRSDAMAAAAPQIDAARARQAVAVASTR